MDNALYAGRIRVCMYIRETIDRSMVVGWLMLRRYCYYDFLFFFFFFFPLELFSFRLTMMARAARELIAAARYQKLAAAQNHRASLTPKIY